MSEETKHRYLSEAERLAILRLEPAFPAGTPGVRAVAYGHALSEEHLTIKDHVQKCLTK